MSCLLYILAIYTRVIAYVWLLEEFIVVLNISCYVIF